MHEIGAFGDVVLVVAVGFALALAWNTVTDRLPIPAPAVFLIGAAVAAELAARLGGALSVRDVERIAVVALILILFDGGMSVGWRRFRASASEIVVLGIVGTFATMGVLALAAHGLLGFSWTTSVILGAALAPTDPAVIFSVLANREIGGRSGTILEGESGANDPVGIALMLGVLAYATHASSSFGGIAWEFLVELSVGVVIGVLAGLLLMRVLQRVSLPGEALYPLRTLAAAGAIYGIATLAHGSGFIAVFIAGVVIGDIRAPYKAEIERFHASLAGIAEIVVFVALGLTIDLGALKAHDLIVDALVLSAVLIVVARPVVVLALLARSKLRRGERLFIAVSGLKGAVPILLAAFAVLEGAPDAARVYGIVFVVVIVSVVGQGSAIAWLASRLGVPMHEVEAEPWDLSIRLAEKPNGIHRLTVTEASLAAGTTIRELPLDEHTWITFVLHEGAPIHPRGAYRVEAGDELIILAPPDAHQELAAIFAAQTSSPADMGRCLSSGQG